MREVHSRAQAIIDEFGLDMKSTDKVKDLSVAYQQMVEIMKAYSRENLKMIAFDEPTASLSDSEIDSLFRIIRKLKANGVQLAVFSNKADALAKEVVKDYFGTQYFTIVRGQMTGVAPKPAAEGTNALLQALHADPASTLYVGDSNVDVETAHNANLPCCGAVWGFRTREELNAAGAEYLAENSDELYDVIMK